MRYTLLFAALVALIGYVASDAVRGPHGLIANQVLRDKIGILAKGFGGAEGAARPA